MTQKTLSILGVIKKKLDNLDLSHKNKNPNEDLISEFDYEVPAKKSNVTSEISQDSKTENSQHSSASNQQNSQNLDQNNSANSSTNSKDQSQDPNQFGLNESGSSKAESSNNNSDKKNNGNFDFNLNFAKDEKNKEVSSSSIDSNSPIEVNKEINNDSAKNPISLDQLFDGSKGNDSLTNNQNSFDNNGLEIKDKSNIEFENIVEEYEDELSDEDLDGGVSTSSIYNLIVKNSPNSFNYPDEKISSDFEFNLPQVQSSVESNLSQIQSSNQVSSSEDLSFNFSDDLSLADEKLFGNLQANSNKNSNNISTQNSNEITSKISLENFSTDSSKNSNITAGESKLNSFQIPIDNLIFPNENQPEKNDNMKNEMKLFSRLSSQSNINQDNNFAISNEEIKLAEKLDQPVFENFKSQFVKSSIDKNNSLQDNQNSNQEIDLEFEKELMGFDKNLTENKEDKNNILHSKNNANSASNNNDISINSNHSVNPNQYQFANDHHDEIIQVSSADNLVNFDNSIIGKSQANLEVNNENYQYQSSSANLANSSLDSKLSDVKSSNLDQQFDHDHDNLDIANEKIFGQKNELNNDFKNTQLFDENHHFEDNASNDFDEHQLNQFEENNMLDNKITSNQYQTSTQHLQQNQYQSSNSRLLLRDEVIMQSSNSIQKLIEAKSMMTGISNFMKTQYPIEIAVQLMEPKLEKWMNENLAQIVEKIVKEEISKIIPKQ